MFAHKLAETVSVLLGPQVWSPLLMVAVAARAGFSLGQLYLWFPVFFLILVVIPISYLYLAAKYGRTTAWDLPQKKDRYLFLGVCCLLLIFSVGLAYLSANLFLYHLNLIILGLLTILTIITYFWKISLHTSLNTAGIILVNYLFDWKLLYLFALLPIIYWARLALHRHNIYQLLGGSLISAAVVLLGLRHFGYL